MATFGMSVNCNEYDAAQALLDLKKSNIREPTNERNDRQECEEAAQLFLSFLKASNVAHSISAKKDNVSKVSVTKIKTRDAACSQLVETIELDVSDNDNGDDDESCMVPIGNGNALIPSRLLRQINWNSYTGATRKLLMAVFPRRILATHSLTGKPSPAFPNKPAKKKLDPVLVSDIVQTVAQRCCVTENVVRTVITTKCADESKMYSLMYRTRKYDKKKRKHQINENIPPT